MGNLLEAEESGKIMKREFSIAWPMFWWLTLLLLALLVEILSSGSRYLASLNFFATLNLAAGYILFMPGSVILPIIVGAAIGAEIGGRVDDSKAALRLGVLNGVYASIIFLLAIAILYETIVYVLPNITPTFSFLVSYWIVLPAVTVVILSTIFAVLSYARRINK